MTTKEAVKHTPGPWTIIGATQVVKFGEDWACIAEVCNIRSKNQGERRIHKCEPADPTNPGWDESCANARLIAAGPPMLEALKEMCAAFVSRNDRQARAIDAAEALIAQVEGR